ncbi:LysM peptidoglycan-binding domain-containing protein [Pararhodonellum marinum]|uniref:LysM peptidoglycan-binding domain-containing protein n=1 Tax=Pararhodonellum marinum TaxID=2755358 RepID=UPI00189006F5|nr:LysM peptidoglycan-binding domain-containing protein [Pararhodonellum marinum]
MKTAFSRLLSHCFIFAFLLSSGLKAQVPQVPSTIQFADMTLRLNEQARREIQLDVDALYRNQNYFQTKLDRVNLYMPVIEQVLAEKGVPTDLKYLVIQESSLIADAVSTSNAVGFWQFKKGTAEEVFLRVDNQVDERKNIVSSTQGAALYLQKHNQYFNNWACALVSYQMGLGGAKGYFGDRYNGNRTMNIDKNSHWYLKKFLAHKVAFEGQLGKLVSNSAYLEVMPVKGPSTVKQIAQSAGVHENQIREYNKWIGGNQIPGDKTYYVTYPRQGMSPSRPVLTSNIPDYTYSTNTPIINQAAAFPKVSGNTSRPELPGQVKVNGIKGILAKNTMSQEAMADRAGIKEGKFRRVNDLDKNTKVEAQRYYYTKRKKNKAAVPDHVVKQGETLWEISQLYGIRLHALKAKNRIFSDKDLRPGMVLKLQEYYQRGESIKMVPVPSQQQSRPVRTSQAVQVNQTVDSNPVSTPQATPPAAPNVAQITHTVVTGETLYALSKKYQVTVDQLKQWNNIGPDNNLKIGQQIIIKTDGGTSNFP